MGSRYTAEMLAESRALTLRQPWADCVAHHGKNVENRSWRPHAGADVILIHAGLGWDTAGDPRIPPEGKVHASRTHGVVVAVARLNKVCNVSPAGWKCGCGPWAEPGQYHWQLTDIVPFQIPIVAMGRQRLWRPTPGLIDVVSRMLGCDR